ALAAVRRVGAGGHAVGLSVGVGLLAVVALGGIVRPTLPAVWPVPVHLAVAIALSAVAGARAARLSEPVRRGLVLASAAVQGLAVLWALP
ncbi:hypothetical protein GTY23_19110, partial [Streptomyces sp. SID5998]|nr:hypothetical protein [Streptomyces sp. SID5998]